MKIQMLNAYIGIEKPRKASKKSEALLHMPETISDMGIVKYIGPEYQGLLQVGQMVYFGDKRHQINVGDNQLQVMLSDNIFAVVLGDMSDSKEEPANP